MYAEEGKIVTMSKNTQSHIKKRGLLMKKILVFLTALVFSLSVAGCGGDSKQDSSMSSSAPQTTEQKAEKQAKVEKEADKEVEKQLKKIKSDTEVKDLMNGAKTKAIGKFSVIEMTSSDFDAVKDIWYFQWAKEKVDSHEWNYAIVVFTDKQSVGAAYNGVLQVNCKLEKDKKDGSYSIGNGDIYVESDSDKGHLKKFDK